MAAAAAAATPYLEAARKKTTKQRQAPKPPKQSEHTSPLVDPADIFSTADLTRPPPLKSIDSLLNATDPPVTTVKHSLFGEQREEHLPFSRERISAERYLLTCVPSDTTIFFDGYKPIAAFRLSEKYRTRLLWEQGDEDKRRDILKAATRILGTRIKAELGVDELNWRIGGADTLAAAIRRYSRFAPYFEHMALEHKLDPRMAYLSFHETNFRNHLLSIAGCEGIFQFDRGTARLHGLLTPPVRLRRKYRSMGAFLAALRSDNETMLNESLHPILAGEAMNETIVDYATQAGGLLKGINAYNVGPDRLERTLNFQQRHSAPKERPPKHNLSKLFAKQYFNGKEFEIDLDPTPALERAAQYAKDLLAPKEMKDFARIINETWRHAHKVTGYGPESSKYTPRVLAYLSAVRPDPNARLFTADRIAVLYRQPDGKMPKGRQLTGAHIARFFQNERAFREYNEHIPLAAPIPHGRGVFLPLGTSDHFFTLHRNLVPTQIVAYDGTGIRKRGVIPA